MFTLNQGKVEREHEVSLSRLELNHDPLPTSKLAASDRLYAMHGIIGAEQYLRLAHAVFEQSRDLRRHLQINLQHNGRQRKSDIHEHHENH